LKRNFTVQNKKSRLAKGGTGTKFFYCKQYLNVNTILEAVMFYSLAISFCSGAGAKRK